MRWLLLLLMVFAIDGTSLPLCAQQGELWDHLKTSEALDDVRGLATEFSGAGSSRLLRLNVTDPIAPRNLAWAAVPTPHEGWGLDRAQSIQATIKNVGPTSITVMVWIVGSNGWGAVGSSVTLDANDTSTIKCNLRETYPDGTPKLDPTHIQQIRFMVSGVDTQSAIEVSDLIATGTAPQWVRPAGRLDLPAMQEGAPAAGRRVRYQLPGDVGSDLYSVLYLPTDWQPDKSYPVIVEYPGNIFYNTDRCWSTGRPEQCAMGFGMTQGQGAIWVSLPFVDRTAGSIAENGFGSNEGKETADYTIDVVADICDNWGGDNDNLILSGFSRGAIACGYIGLSNDNIAGLWKGFVACQHYDGSAWNQSNMASAVQRAPRFSGQAIFQIDNSQEKYQPVVDATDPSVKWTWIKSGLGYHATAMFLDDRPSTLQLRQWFRNITAQTDTPPPNTGVAADAVTPVDVSVLQEGIEQVEIYLLMGQSNMKGRGGLPETQTANPLILNMNMADEQWYPARHPLHKAGAPDLIDGSDKAGVGPGLAFARTRAKQKDNVLVALIPVAQGGSWVNLWGDGSDNYEKTIRRANKALADFPQGKARIAGALWLQGESDTLEARYEAYAGKLTSLIERLRADLNEPKLPFIACTIRPDIVPKGKYLHVKEINDDLLSLPQRVPNTACVDARDLKGHIGDFMHYDSESQQSIGQRYGQEYLWLRGSAAPSSPKAK
jgi:hypothetical protein